MKKLIITLLLTLALTLNAIPSGIITINEYMAIFIADSKDFLEIYYMDELILRTKYEKEDNTVVYSDNEDTFVLIFNDNGTVTLLEFLGDFPIYEMED
jgi:hypothetical protein